MTAKKRVSKTRPSKVTALPTPPKDEQAPYITMNPQAQAQALLKRLAALENDHYQYSVLIEEEAAVGNEQAIPPLQQEMTLTEKRIEFIRNKMESMGVAFGEQPESSEQVPENTDDEEQPSE